MQEKLPFRRQELRNNGVFRDSKGGIEAFCRGLELVQKYRTLAGRNGKGLFLVVQDIYREVVECDAMFLGQGLREQR